MDVNSLPTKNSENGSPTPVMCNGVRNVRLPKIELKPFTGDPKDWPQFWALFEAAVDSQPIPTGVGDCWIERVQVIVGLKEC
ncbi:unnamed protein product [Gongylonema pulchrum]|uniref:Med13_N domain-containing protein n=1 Tax=Gongylonema pulchrum TaxID=637853 RepID=A0A183DYF9_9BILA|nr:unnamed protein product [Gongylonema pulchrum]